MPSITNVGGSISSAVALTLLAWAIRTVRGATQRRQRQAEGLPGIDRVAKAARFACTLKPAALRMLVSGDNSAAAANIAHTVQVGIHECCGLASWSDTVMYRWRQHRCLISLWMHAPPAMHSFLRVCGRPRRSLVGIRLCCCRVISANQLAMLCGTEHSIAAAQEQTSNVANHPARVLHSQTLLKWWWWWARMPKRCRTALWRQQRQASGAWLCWRGV